MSYFFKKIKQLSHDLGEKYRLANQPIFGEIELTFRLLGHLANSNCPSSTSHIDQMIIETELLRLTELQLAQAVKAFELGQQMLGDIFEASLRYSQLDELAKEILLQSCWRMIWADHHLAVREYQLVHLWGYWLGWSRSAIEKIGEPFRPIHISLEHQQALTLLNITVDTGSEIIKQRYKQQLSRYHPDKVIGAGGNKDEINEATEITTKIHEAYALIRMLHNF